jgi:hypothetical protein
LRTPSAECSARAELSPNTFADRYSKNFALKNFSAAREIEANRFDALRADLLIKSCRRLSHREQGFRREVCRRGY